MSYFYFFLIVGSIVVYLILKFDKQQRSKQKVLLKQTTDVEPLLLMRSLGQKLGRLNSALIQNPARNELDGRLKKITAEYTRGQIDIQTYNNQINELLNSAEAR
jgi:hypothetical protein